jgi:tRNA modification GTPase
MSKLYEEDSIVGISTAQAPGAIAIIRVSGINAISIVSKIFKGENLQTCASHTIHYGHIVDLLTQEVIDEVLVSVFKAPKTYTKEDVVEINTHGGLFVTNSVYEQVVLAGARPAEPGEFTKRAFLNGRIDLTRAEAVMDLIEAENKASVKMAVHALNGDIERKVNKLKEQLIQQISLISASIDYPEYYDTDSLSKDKILPATIEVKKNIDLILENSKSAKYLKNGINTAIVGRPNVGKSSILNLLTGENRAIVTSIPGTTRDTIEVKINLKNVTLNLIDTAGIHETKDLVENIGIDKARQAIKDAELVLFVFDGSEKTSKEDEDLFQLIQNKKYIVLKNKSDLPQVETNQQFNEAISVCANDSKDIDIIEDAILSKIELDQIMNKDITYISNARQLSKLKEASDCLKDAIEQINNNAFIDCIEIYLHDAWNVLSEISGECTNEDFLDQLFSRFCLGK